MHEWDGQTPLEETLGTLDDLVRSGKVRYIGCSNYAGWQLLKALGISDRLHLERFVSQQIYYSLQARDAEYELVPATLDQGLGSSSGARSRAACSRASTAATQPPRRAVADRLERATVRDEDRSTTSSTRWSRSARATASRPPRSALAYTLGRPGV